MHYFKTMFLLKHTNYFILFTLPTRSGHWPITIFFLFPFCQQSLICLEGKLITPYEGNTILFRSSQQLSRLRLRTLEGLLEQTQCSSNTLDSPRVLVLNFRDTRTP